MTDLTPGGADEPRLAYRLEIAAPNVADVVRNVGGLVFDRVLLGWEVLALVGELDDDRPLRILGARGICLDTAFDRGRPLGPRSLAVSAELFERDARVQRWVLAARDRGLREVALWGESPVRQFIGTAGLPHHRLTAGARAFKAVALAAAGVRDASVGGTETFLTGAVARPRGAADLVSADSGEVRAASKPHIIDLKTAGVRF